MEFNFACLRPDEDVVPFDAEGKGVDFDGVGKVLALPLTASDARFCSTHRKSDTTTLNAAPFYSSRQ